MYRPFTLRLKFPLLTKLLPKAYQTIPVAYQNCRKFNYSCTARTMAMYGLLHTKSYQYLPVPTRTSDDYGTGTGVGYRYRSYSIIGIPILTGTGNNHAVARSVVYQTFTGGFPLVT